MKFWRFQDLQPHLDLSPDGLSKEHAAPSWASVRVSRVEWGQNRANLVVGKEQNIVYQGVVFRPSLVHIFFKLVHLHGSKDITGDCKPQSCAATAYLLLEQLLTWAGIRAKYGKAIGKMWVVQEIMISFLIILFALVRDGFGTVQAWGARLSWPHLLELSLMEVGLKQRCPFAAMKFKLTCVPLATANLFPVSNPWERNTCLCTSG